MLEVSQDSGMIFFQWIGLFVIVYFGLGIIANLIAIAISGYPPPPERPHQLAVVIAWPICLGCAIVDWGNYPPNAGWPFVSSESENIRPRPKQTYVPRTNDDRTAWGIAADYLEEHGETRAAALLRLFERR